MPISTIWQKVPKSISNDDKNAKYTRVSKKCYKKVLWSVRWSYLFWRMIEQMGKTHKPRDFLMKRKDVVKKDKPRPEKMKVLSPMGMLEIMKRKNPKEFAEALRNLKKTCMVCGVRYYGHGKSYNDGIICADCVDCFGEVDINEKSIEVVRAYRRSNGGGVEKETISENLS